MELPSSIEKTTGEKHELTAKDRELIQKQCELQHATSPEQIAGFTEAYVTAKNLALNAEQLAALSPEQVQECILLLAKQTESRNENGFRQVPVTFASGGKALDAENIPRAIAGFCQGFTSFISDPTEDERFNTTLLYKEFEAIHPFEDGNGRVGDLLWKILETRKTNQWPETLPPDVFGSKK